MSCRPVHETENFVWRDLDFTQPITLVFWTMREKRHNILLPVEVSRGVTRTGLGRLPNVEKPPQEEKIWWDARKG